MLNVFDFVVIMCGFTGMFMVIGSIYLLYRGVIKLGEKAAGSAIEAEFKNQLKVNVRNPALGLFAIGFSFFVLALYFAHPKEDSLLVISGHIKVANADSILVKLKSEEWPILVSSEGEIFATVQPLEKLAVAIEAPGYTPRIWFHPIRPDETKNGHVEIHPEFVAAPGTPLTKIQLDPAPPFKPYLDPQ